MFLVGTWQSLIQAPPKCERRTGVSGVDDDHTEMFVVHAVLRSCPAARRADDGIIGDIRPSYPTALRAPLTEDRDPR